MELETKYFGAVRADEASVLYFPEGIFAFEEEKRFLLIPFDENDDSMLCLQSVTTPQLAFVAMNPFSIWQEYAPILNDKELKAFDVARSEDLCYYVFCVVKDPIADSTVNLRCPIVINDRNREARQVILDQYEMRHLLSELVGKEGAPC